MVLLHIWLDCITTYGTMIFQPFSSMRVRLNAVFIIDLLLTLPLLWAIWRWRARRGLMLLAAAWLFVYPGLSMGLNAWHTAQTRARLTAQGRPPQSLVVLPDAFAPFFWRALYTVGTPDGLMVHTQGMDKNRSELFAHFSYDDSLTYEALIEVEEDLTRDVELLLQRAGAAHLDFTPLGDALMFQCVFEAHRPYVYRKIALEIAALLPQGVRGRLLCLDKNFESMEASH